MAAISPTALPSAASLVFLQNLHLYFTSINFRGFAPRSKFLFPALFLPELSAAFLFRLCCRVVSTGKVVLSTIEVRSATSGHLRLSPTQVHGTCTSPPLLSALGITTISPTALLSAASPVLLAFFFQSSPQPSSFGYVVGLSRLGRW